MTTPETGPQTPPAASRGSEDRVLDVSVVVAVLVGVVARIRAVAAAGSLWLDEAMLAGNIVKRDHAGLLEPLDSDQGAPVGFLWIERTLFDAVGLEEAWMRLPALVAGIAVIPLTYLLARSVFDRRVAGVAAALVALAPGMVRYSAELKQYSVDAAVAVGLALLAHRYVRTGAGRDLGWLAVGGAVALVVSHAAIVVAAGVGIALLVRDARADGVRAGVRRLAPVGLAWVIAFGVLYVVSLRDLAANDSLTDYWQGGFPEHATRPDLVAWWLGRRATELLGSLGGLWPAVLGLGLAVGGAVLACRRPGWTVLVAFVPVMLVAALLGLYPFRGRLALYAVPSLLVLVAAGVVGVANRRHRLVGLATIGVVAAAPLVETTRLVLDPHTWPDNRGAVAFAAERVTAGDEVLIHGFALPMFEVYGPTLGLQATGRSRWGRPEECRVEPDPPSGRVWILYGSTHSDMDPREPQILLSHLDAMGRRLTLFERHGAFAALYDFDAVASDPTGRHTVRTDVLRCVQLEPG